MVAANHNMHGGAKALRSEKIPEAFRFPFAYRDVNIAHRLNLRKLLQRMLQDRLPGNLCKLLRGFPRMSAGLRRHTGAKSRGGNDDDHSHGKRSIEQSRDRVIGRSSEVNS